MKNELKNGHMNRHGQPKIANISGRLMEVPRYTLIFLFLYILSIFLFLHFFKGIFIFSLKASNIFIKAFLWSFSFASSVSECSGLADVESLVSDGTVLLLILLNVFLHGHPSIFSSNGCRWGLRFRWLLLYRCRWGCASACHWCSSEGSFPGTFRVKALWSLGFLVGGDQMCLGAKT